jgi:hypothetical protein
MKQRIYEKLPSNLNENEQAICRYCRYRNYKLEWEIAKERAQYSRKLMREAFFPSIQDPVPECQREICLIDNKSLRTPYMKRLLNKYSVNNTDKKTEKEEK